MTFFPEQILFLPVADNLQTPVAAHPMGWPGFGNTPPNPNVTSLKHLALLALAKIDIPTALVAQSMGGVVAVHIRLSGCTPEAIRSSC